MSANSIMTNSAFVDPYPTLPAELKALKRFLVYKLEPKADGFNKIPYHPNGQKMNDPTQGVSYEEMVAALPKFDGAGLYVESPYVAFDLDKCIDDQMNVSQEAAEILRELDSYSEMSPSQKGIHVWCRGQKPGPACRKSGIEIYDSKRFLTLTGFTIPQMPDVINERSDAIAKVYTRVFGVEAPSKTEEVPQPEPAAEPKPSVQVESSGSVITTKLQLLSTGKIISQKPFVIEDEHGNRLEYTSQSEADLALTTELAFKFKGDEGKIVEAFRESSLFRKKFERPDYQTNTIVKAVQAYKDSLKPQTVPTTTESAIASDQDWRSYFCTVSELQTGGIPMLVDGFMTEGVSLVGALPGGCKTLFALSIARALTTGKPLFGKYKVPVVVPVLYLIPESDGGSFRGRCDKFEIPYDPNLFLCRTISQGNILQIDHPAVKAAVQSLRPLVILDTMIRFNRSDDENSSIGNKQFADNAFMLLGLGARGVLGLHHATKASRNEAPTLENMLRGTGDLGAICDNAFGLKRDDHLYDNGRGPLEVAVHFLKPRHFDDEPPAPVVIAARGKQGDELVSYINTTHDFFLIEGRDAGFDLDSRFVEIVTKERFLSYQEIADLLHVKKSRVQSIAKKLKYYKSDSGWTLLRVNFGTSAEPAKEVEV